MSSVWSMTPLLNNTLQLATPTFFLSQWRRQLTPLTTPRRTLCAVQKVPALRNTSKTAGEEKFPIISEEFPSLVRFVVPGRMDLIVDGEHDQHPLGCRCEGVELANCNAIATSD